MRRAGLAVLMLVAAAGVSAANDAPAGAPTGGGPAPRTWWSIDVGGGPAFAGKAMRWTGPDRATDLRGGVGGLALVGTWLDDAAADRLAWRLGGELMLATLGRRGFAPTPTLQVDEFEARHAGLLLVAGIVAPGTGRRTLGIPAAVYADLAVGLIEIDVDIAFAAGGPVPVHHHDTELAVRLEAGVILGAPWWRAGAPGGAWQRISLRVGVQFFAADKTVITTASGSLGGYRPDHWAVRVGLGVAL